MPSSADELKRLTAEKDEADRRYNEALTALDATLPRLPELPHPPPPLDEHQITPLNQAWQILPADPPTLGRGWRARLSWFIWSLVAPSLQRQQEFNSAVVDHVNRNIPKDRETTKAIASTIAVLRDQLEALVRFESHLIVFLQRITLYVDTKDREVAGLMRGLSAAIDGVGGELAIRWESMVARERRYDARVTSLAAAQTEIQTEVALLLRASMTLKRAFEQALADPRGQPAGEGRVDRAAPAGFPPPSALDSYKYVGFEDQFRGSQAEIRSRVAEYLPYFRGASDVLDIGCGRGEFLELLREQGVSARGLDVNPEMVEVCRGRRLDVEEADALGYLASLPDASLGGLFAAQVVEHLEPAYLMRLIETAHHKLRPNSKIILETINPACWLAFFESYIRDVTHVRPLHPDTLKYLMVASGFQHVDVRYRAPYPEHQKLQLIAVPATSNGQKADLSDLVETFNANVEKINGLLFTHLDYAAIGERL